MKQGKRILSFILSIALLIGLLPSFAAEKAEASEPVAGETLIFEDNFDSGDWGSSWAFQSTNTYAGTIDKERAYLGNDNNGRNYYGTKLGDVHVSADLCVVRGCVNSNASRLQNHLIFARAPQNNAMKGIFFGLQTTVGDTKASLVVGYNSSDSHDLNSDNILFNSGAIYDIGEDKVYTLDLYVFGTWILASCNGTPVYSGQVQGVETTGFCGIKDRFAYANSDATNQKGGYFDNFRLSTITLTDMQVQGSVVCDSEGVGKANVDLNSGDTTIIHLEDTSVNVSEFENAAVDKYTGEYSVSLVDATWGQWTDIVDTVYVVDDISQAVISMTDERWTGTTESADPQFTLDTNGKAQLKKSALSVLDGAAGEAYNDFYVEYDLQIDEPGLFNNYLEQYFLMSATYAKTTENAILTEFFVDPRTNSNVNKDFWARFKEYTTNSSTTTWTQEYSTSNEDPDIFVAKDYFTDGSYDKTGAVVKFTVGMLIHDKTVKFMINGKEVLSKTGELEYAGRFAIKGLSQDATTTVANFRCIPISDKQLVDINVTAPTQAKSQDNLQVSVVPVYNWPYEAGEATNVTAEIDSKTLGVQEGTVTYRDGEVSVSKDITVEFLNYQPIVTEDFAGTDFSDAAQWKSTPSGFTFAEGVAKTSGSASAIVSESFANGFVEADITLVSSSTLDDWSENPGTAAGKTVLAGVLRRQVDSNHAITARFSVTRNTENVDTAIIQSFVRDGDSTAHMGSSIKLTDFEWGKTYKVRLSCIGNYYEVQVNGEVKSQFTLDSENVLINQADTRFAIANENGTTVKWDNLTIGEYDTYSITKTNADTLVLPMYFDYRTSSANPMKNERSTFIQGEDVVITTADEQELKVGGLYYTVDSDTQDPKTKYPINQRNAEAGEDKTNCNEFVLLSFPYGDITITDEYYDSDTATQANMNVIGVSIREAQDELKTGIRFKSRASQQFVSDGTEYTLKEVGTLLFKAETAVESSALESCFENDGYIVGEKIVGKKKAATTAVDVCNAFVDWSLCLTYEAGSTLKDTKYAAYGYAVYEAEGREDIVQYVETPRIYSYNDVAGIVNQ